MRAFLAIDLPEEVKDYLEEIKAKIGNDYAKINWVEKNKIHITLKFLGEIDDEKLKKVKDLLKIQLQPFTIKLTKLGVFPSSSYINIVWIGLKENPLLFELHKIIDMNLSKLFPMETDFIGHITLGRVKFVAHKKEFINKLNSIKIEEKEVEVENVKLYKSTLTPKGPIYEVIETYS